MSTIWSNEGLHREPGDVELPRTTRTLYDLIAEGTVCYAVNLSAEQNKKWQEAIAPVVQEWTKTTPDGDKVLAAYRGFLQKGR